MRRGSWLWIVAGVGAAALISRRRRSALGLPIEGSEIPKVTPHGDYGAHRAGPPVHAHQGVDLVARPGSRVLAIGDGVIVSTDPGLGRIVRKLRLDTPASWGGALVDAIVYADLGKPLVSPGDRVRKGDAIATVAPAGFVHFAVKQRRANAESFIDPKLAGFAYQPSTSEAAHV